MLEPIDIDINMNQNISEEAPKAAQANEEMTKSVDSMQKEIERLNKVVVDMSTALAEQRKLTADNAGEFDNATKKIEVMQTALDKAEKELAVYQSTCEQMNKAVQEGADVTNVLSDAKEALSQTEGALVDNAKELVNNQEDINEVLGEAGKSTEVYSASNQILSVAIKSVCDNLGIESTQVKNAIGNIRVIAAVKMAWTNSVKLLNTQLGLSIGLSRLFVATGIGAIIAAIGLVIVAYQNWSKKQQEVKDKIAARNQELADRITKQNDIIAESAAKTMTAYKKLQKEWDSLAGSLKEKEKFITDNKKEFEGLGIQVRSVADAENVLVSNTDAVVKSFMIRARAAAASELAADTYKKAIEKQIEAEKRAKSPTKQEFAHSPAVYKYEDIDGHKNVPVYIGTEASIKAAQEIQKESEKLFKEADDLTNDQIDYLKQAGEELKKAGITATSPKQPKTPKKPKTTEQEKATSTLEKKAYDYQKRIDAARVAAIHDGAEKERQAAKAEYDQTQAFIEKELKEIAELEKKTGKPADQQRTMLLEYDVEATRQYEAELGRINAQSKATLNEIFTEVNARFASELDQSITDITRYYDQLIREATKAGATLDELDQLRAAKKKDIDRAGIHDQLRKIDLDEALEMEKANNLASIGLTTIAEQTKYEIVKKYLKDRIDLLRKVGDESSNKEADILEARLKGLQTSPKSISGLVNGALFDKIKKGFEKVTNSEEEAEQKTTSLFSNFQKGGAQAVAAINEIKGVFGGLDEGLDKALDAVGNIAQGFATGGIAGGAMAVIGEGIKMFTSAAQVEKEHQEALRQLALAKLEMQREYNLLLLKEQLYYKQGSNIFGTNQIRGAANSILTYRDSIAQLKKEMQGEKPNEAMGALYDKMANSKNGLVASMGKQRLDEYKKQMDAYNKGIGALADVDIVTGSRKSGWGFWKKRKDVYSGLLETYDDVIDKEGKLNTNRIQAILNTHKMSDENRALLESLLKLDEAAKEAEEQLKSYLTQTFGGLGDALTDSIVTAFANGTDAAQLFKGNVTDVLNDIAKQMVFGLYLKDTFDKLEKDIHNAYEDLADDKLTEQQLSEKITNILGGFFGGLDGDIDKANKFLEEFWKNAEANGFDRPEGERQGATAGLANASQDSVNEGVGLLYGVRQMLGDIRQDNREELLIHRTIMGQIAVLVERSEYWEHLKQLPKVVQKLEDIESYGLKLKGL